MATELHVGHGVQLILAALGNHLKRKQEILRKVTTSLPPFSKTRVITAHD